MTVPPERFLMPAAVTRRRFVVDSTSCMVALLGATASSRIRWRAPEYGRFSARPGPPPKDPLAPGEHTLSVVNDRSTTVFVPSSATPGRPAPVVLALHGATGDSAEAQLHNRAAAEASGVIVVAPSSVGVTWDAIRGFYDVDFAHIDATLAEVFRRCAVDPSRLAVSGFSDGASYAISLGIVNGDLFTHVMGYSAGFIIPGKPHGHPRFFMTHGLEDQILPIDRCGRRIATSLRGTGYDVQFIEFTGGHRVQPELVDRALHWLVG